MGPAGADGVDADLAAAPFDGQRTGQGQDRGLGGAVGRAVDDSALGQVGDDVHDATVPLIQHALTHGLAEHEGGADVAGVKLVPLAEGDVGGRFGEEAAGVVDEDVDPVMRGGEGSDDRGC